MALDDQLRSEIAAIAADDCSGATELLTRGLAILRAAATRGALVQAADELCRAQPAMAALRTAAVRARRASDPVSAIDAFAARTARAPALIARHTVALLRLRRRAGPVRLVTWSRSRAVEVAALALAREMDVEVACAEARPALEGRGLAAALAEHRVRVTLYTDAGVATALEGAEAFLSGADAIGPDAFINKVGTGALAALAAVEGVPTYVLAGREKFLPPTAFGELTLPAGRIDQVWAAAPAGVTLANPSFERVRASLAAAFVTDAGVIPPENITEVCAGNG